MAHKSVKEGRKEGVRSVEKKSFYLSIIPHMRSLPAMGPAIPYTLPGGLAWMALLLVPPFERLDFHPCHAIQVKAKRLGSFVL